MAELAFNVNGERFEVPGSAEFWRVRRFKPSGRGTPDVVFGRDGLPLLAPIESDIQEFRRMVEAQPGRYRLDAIDGEHRACEDSTPAYLQLAEMADGPPVAGRSAAGSQEDLIRELVRVNAEIVRNITDKFASVMESAATLIRAADGAGIPARAPLAPPAAVVEEPDYEDDDDGDQQAPRNAAMGGLMAQVMPLIQYAVSQLGANESARATRNAAPNDDQEKLRDEDEEIEADVDVAPPEPIAVAVPGMADMAHLLEIQRRLTPDEARLAMAVREQLSPTETNQWISHLSTMSVDDAVALIRGTIAKVGKGGAS